MKTSTHSAATALQILGEVILVVEREFLGHETESKQQSLNETKSQNIRSRQNQIINRQFQHT